MQTEITIKLHNKISSHFSCKPEWRKGKNKLKRLKKRVFNRNMTRYARNYICYERNYICYGG